MIAVTAADETSQRQMRFLLDEDIKPAVAAIGRGLGLDVVSVHEVDRRGLADEEQLRFAVDVGRVLVTRNRDDFLRLFSIVFQEAPALGLLIVPHTLPNHRPERIARSLKRWAERGGAAGSHFVDFLSA